MMNKVLFVSFLMLMAEEFASSHEMCPPGMVYTECGSACPVTCTRKPEVCTTLCVEGCFCPVGQIWKESSGECVPPEKC
uniref:U21-Theraphotoxin-Sfo1a_1 n=1 Tax=Selenotholus foelschei TaxID=1905327 RepID=A0A482ZE39_9ARAC